MSSGRKQDTNGIIRLVGPQAAESLESETLHYRLSLNCSAPACYQSSRLSLSARGLPLSSESRLTRR